METINLKGKEYVTVNERLKAFRETFKDYALISDIIELTPETCTIMAKIIDEKGIVRATGLAQEQRQASFVNKTSYVENCETSAWGRALGNFGIGIDSAICTADELLMALNAQKDSEKPAKKKEAKSPEDAFLSTGSAVKASATKAGKYELSDADIVAKAQKSIYSDEEVTKKTQGAIDFFKGLKMQLLADDKNIASAKLLIEINRLRGMELAADTLTNTMNEAIERTSSLDDSIPY